MEANIRHTNTLHDIVASIQHYFRDEREGLLDYSTTIDFQFVIVFERWVLDVMMKESGSDGLGLTKKQREVYK